MLTYRWSYPPLGHASRPLSVVTGLVVAPYAAQLCSRSVILDEGAIVADRATRNLLTDPDILARHLLELPYGFDVPIAAGLPRPG